ncbi:putative leucine aminopeptidase [Orchesella cincta]|uniref:Putative leucine aminopeptidase n=1 Tax=Orchesella cincta TaxID=48709 RepID=A0A1D2MKM3_ORCCI|nr:putative leucine aminopeptidase [Orchesella cincta]
MDFKCLLILSLLSTSLADPPEEQSSNTPASAKAREYEFIYSENPLQQKHLVHKLFPQLDRTSLKESVDTLSSSENRAKTPNDDGASILEDSIRKLLAKYEGGSVFFNKIESSSSPKSYLTPNLIASFEGKDLLVKNERVILSTHYDRVPVSRGADDNYSGCAVHLEVLRLIAKFSLKFKHTVELHFYAGNRAGLKGSADVARKYQEDKIRIKGLLNLDSVGNYASKYGRVLGLVLRLEIDGKKVESPPSFEAFVKKLVKEYSKEPAVELECNNRGCNSDHLSWHERDFPWAFITEVEASPNIDTEKDIVDEVDFEQVVEFAKVALAFVIEAGELAEVPEIEHHSSSAVGFLKPELGWIWSGLACLAAVTAGLLNYP